MDKFNKNKLIGIPFRLNCRDFKGCDCRGIVYLYYKHVKNKELPFSDGKNIFFRNRKKDIERMINILKTFSRTVKYEELQEGDLILINNPSNSTGALGVCINNYQVLHMDRVVGSCLTKLEYLKSVFLFGFRPIC